MSPSSQAPPLLLLPDLFSKETDFKLYANRTIITQSGALGTIDSAFGSSGKFKVEFKTPAAVRAGEKIFFRSVPKQTTNKQPLCVWPIVVGIN